MFYFHSYLGEIPILTNIFQMGWNHQPDDYWEYLAVAVFDQFDTDGFGDTFSSEL